MTVSFKMHLIKALLSQFFRWCYKYECDSSESYTNSCEGQMGKFP